MSQLSRDISVRILNVSRNHREFENILLIYFVWVCVDTIVEYFNSTELNWKNCVCVCVCVWGGGEGGGWVGSYPDILLIE